MTNEQPRPRHDNTRRILLEEWTNPQTGQGYHSSMDVDGELFDIARPVEEEGKVAARYAEVRECMTALRPVLPAREWMRLQDAIDNHTTATRQAVASYVVDVLAPMMDLGGRATGVIIRDAAEPRVAALPAPGGVLPRRGPFTMITRPQCWPLVAGAAASFVVGLGVCSMGLLGALAGALGQASASMGGLIH